MHYRLLCYFVLPYLVFYLIIIPILIFLKLYRNKNLLQTFKFKLRWGYVYGEFEENVYFWEFAKMYLKVGFIIFLSYYHDYQVVKGILIFILLFFYGELNQIYKPYYEA